MSALSAMCVRTHGKGGKAFGLGESSVDVFVLVIKQLSRNLRPPEEHLHPDLRRESGSESVCCKCCQYLHISLFVGFGGFQCFFRSKRVWKGV